MHGAALLCAACHEPDAAPGVIVCIHSFGSIANGHPHLHVLMTDGAFRDDGSFIASPTHDAAVLESVWQRAVLAWFVDQGWLDEDAAQAMLAWPHSGFGAHLGPAIPGDDRECPTTTRVGARARRGARRCARGGRAGGARG